MLNKILEYIKNFFKEVGNDLKKLNILSIFTTPRLLIIAILILLAIVIVFSNLNIFLVLKGVISGLILYFVFLWRK